MARGNSSSGKKKKKSQGKKARAKAKLDRHWGQHVDDDEIKAAKYRKGRSRLLQQKRTGTSSKTSDRTNSKPVSSDRSDDQRMENKQIILDNFDDDVGLSRNEDSDSEDDSDMEESSTRDNDVGTALHLLLHNIDGSGSAKNKTKRGVARSGDEDADTNDDDSEVEYDMDQYYGNGNIQGNSYEEESDEEEVADDFVGDDEENIDDEDENGAPIRGIDGFAAHFNQAPLPESEDELTKVISPLQKMRRAPNGTPYLDSSLEVTLSGPILNQLKENTTEAGTVKNSSEAFEELSVGYFSSVRQVLARNWRNINAKAIRSNVDGDDSEGGRSTKKTSLTALQSTIFPSLSSYADLQITAETRENRHDVNNLLALHILNHVLTSRGRVQKHNRRMKELREREANDSDNDSAGGVDEADEERWRDQGYTRPKVLILLPTRGSAHTFVRRMVSIMGESADIDHFDRFEAEYSGGVEQDDADRADDQESQRRKAVLESKGEDWNELFGEHANDDDDFKIGMSLTPNASRRSKKGAKKTKTSPEASGGISVKFYSEFYRSDIILASPLALKMATSEDEETDSDVDFLSSVEMCVVPQADVLLMQNWDHVTGCLEVLNHQPTKSNDTDFSRVRNYLLAGQAAYWKQLIFVSRISDPYIMSTFKRHAKSVGGRLKVRRKVSADEASICEVLARVRQVFQRIPCEIQSQGDDRLKYFTEKVLPQITRLHQKHTLIYIPSYFDFVSLRNKLMQNDSTSQNFVSVTEYSRVSEVSRGRARFSQGRKAIMLYTGRAHFFLRHQIKGARHIILFGLPEHSEFYPELMNMLLEGPSGDSEVEVEAPSSCLALFTKYEAHALERIVGTKHCERMVKGDKNTFLFCS